MPHHTEFPRARGVFFLCPIALADCSAFCREASRFFPTLPAKQKPRSSALRQSRGNLSAAAETPQPIRLAEANGVRRIRTALHNLS